MTVRSFGRGYGTIVLVGLLAGVLAMKAIYLGELVTLALHPGSLTYTEGINGLLAARPELWFQPFDVAPYMPTIYPLFYHAVVNYTVSRSGLNVFQAMHLLSLTSSILTGAIMVYWLKDWGVRLQIALVAAGLYVLSPTVTGGTVLGRVDHFGIFLGMAALFVATYGDRGAPIEAGALTICVLFVKQSLIAFPAAILAYYWMNEYRRDALAYASTVFLVGGGALVWLVGMSNGRAWYQLVTLNGAQALVPQHAGGLAISAVFVHVGLAAIAINGFRWRPREITVLFLVFAVLSGVALSAKPGAWAGYFLPAILAAALYVGIVLEAAVKRWDTTIGLLVLAILVIQFGVYGVWQPVPEYPPEAQNAVVSELQEIDGPILSVDNGILVRLDREQQPHELLLIRSLPEAYRPPGSMLLDDIHEQKFAAIVLRRPLDADVSTTRWTREQFDAINESYQLQSTHGPYRVHVPRE